MDNKTFILKITAEEGNDGVVELHGTGFNIHEIIGHLEEVKATLIKQRIDQRSKSLVYVGDDLEEAKEMLNKIKGDKPNNEIVN